MFKHGIDENINKLGEPITITMNELPEEKALELKRLEEIATQKRIAYEELDSHVYKTGSVCEDVDLLINYTRAKAELTAAVNEYNSFKAQLVRIYSF